MIKEGFDNKNKDNMIIFERILLYEMMMIFFI